MCGEHVLYIQFSMLEHSVFYSELQYYMLNKTMLGEDMPTVFWGNGRYILLSLACGRKSVDVLAMIFAQKNVSVKKFKITD